MSKDPKLTVVTTDQDPEIAKEFGNQEFLIDPKDFESISVMITFTNTTSRTGGENIPAYQLMQLHDKGLTLEVPTKSCAEGHNLTVSVSSFNSDMNISFECTAKIEELRKCDETADEITVTMLQYPEADWQKFKSLFTVRQEEIERFFRAAKGF